MHGLSDARLAAKLAFLKRRTELKRSYVRYCNTCRARHDRAGSRAANRLARLVERYQRRKPKRSNNPLTGQQAFVPEVCALCQEARCAEAVLLAKAPHRAKAPAPHTLADWLRAYRREGRTAFLRSVYNAPPAPAELRSAAIARAAIEWLNARWREYSSPRHLYQALREEAELQGWTSPSESWLYRQWQHLAESARERRAGET